MKKKQEDDSKCFTPRCRTKIRDGEGAQVVNSKGEVERYCQKHWQAMCKREEAEAERRHAETLEAEAKKAEEENDERR